MQKWIITSLSCIVLSVPLLSSISAAAESWVLWDSGPAALGRKEQYKTVGAYKSVDECRRAASERARAVKKGQPNPLGPGRIGAVVEWEVATNITPPKNMPLEQQHLLRSYLMHYEASCWPAGVTPQ